MNSLAVNLLDPQSIIAGLGTIGVLAILFLESGLLIGLFFPGDSLLFMAGVGASGSAAKLLDGVQLSLPILLMGAPIAAIAGGQLGHWFGAKFGPALFDRPDGRFFNHAKVEKTEAYLEKYGVGRAIILAHFVPFARTLLNPLCGIVGVSAKRFFIFNVIGGLIWTQSLILLGYILGEEIQGSIDRYILPIVALVVLASLTPLIFEYAKKKRERLQP